MAWSNQKIYSALQSLPDESPDAFVINPDWTSRVILKHIVRGANWFVYCLGLGKLERIRTPNSTTELQGLGEFLARLDSKILEASTLEYELLEIQEDEGSFKAFRSTIIAQALHHATEHRAQLIDALESRNFTPIKLDDIDLWAFQDYENPQI